jgi:hypothetical protein
MGETDWTIATDSLSQPSVDRGVTTGIARPNGGGNFIYGFSSLEIVNGAVALFPNQANFAPSSSGGSIRGAVKRGISGGKLNFSPFLIIGWQGPSVNDEGYIIGLSDADPSRIALRKGVISSGVPGDEVGSGGILAVSTATFDWDTWLHLRLDQVVNDNGDVILNMYQNDLGTNPVTAPVWEAIEGLSSIVDDALGVNTGSAPFTSGRFGFGFAAQDITRRGYFDHLEVFRQL